MARLGINTGTIPNDGTGDSLINGAIKINNNFSEVYSYFGDGTNLTSGSWRATSAGINTTLNVGIGTTNPRFLLEVGSVGSSTTSLHVNGNTRITGILTVGSSSIIIDGNNDTVKVGSAVTINGNTGIISAKSIILNDGQTISGIQTYTSTSGISSYSSVAGVATYASNAGVATYAATAGSATTATNLADAGNINTGTINTGRLSGSYNINISGSAGYASTAGVSTALKNSRTFEITGDVVASAISFDGTGNVSLAATIQPNSVGLGTDTFGDYVRTIDGTSNQVTVSSATGEGSSPIISLPNSLTAPQDLTVTRDLQVNRDLNVNGNITIGGTSATLFTTELKVYDADIILGIRTDSNNNDVSNDTTANHGGIAIASTEGTPLIQLYDVGIGETNPSTYKKIMWFKSSSWSGLSTDAWLFNYGVGIGSTQIPNGVRLAVDSIHLTKDDISKIRNINSSGIITASSFSGTATTATNLENAANITSGTISTERLSGTYSININGYSSSSGVSTAVIGGIGSVTSLNVSGVSTFTNGPVFIGSGTSTGTASQPLQVTGGAYVSGSVGIGTTNPSGILQAYQDQNASTIFYLSNPNSGSSARSRILVASDASVGNLSLMMHSTNYAGAEGQGWVSTSGVNTPLILGTVGTERLRVETNGNIGIGTTNPTYKLEVNGSTRVGVDTSAGVILTSPNGTKYQLFVENDGTLKTVAV